MAIFKYLKAEDGLRYLRGWHLKYSAAADFDDLFEFNPVLIPGRVLHPGGHGVRVDLEGMEVVGAQQLHENSNAFDEAGRHIGTAILDALRTEVGSLCLSRNDQSTKMWYSYAQDHQGVMLGFSERHSCFSRVDERCGNGFGRLHDISYVDERPTFTLNPFDVNGSITSVALTKDRKEWGWQQEVRLLWPLSIPDRLVGEHRLYRVPPGALESVTVGCKATCLEEIKAQLKATALATGHVSLRQAELGSSGYDFVYRIIDRNG